MVDAAGQGPADKSSFFRKPPAASSGGGASVAVRPRVTAPPPPPPVPPPPEPPPPGPPPVPPRPGARRRDPPPADVLRLTGHVGRDPGRQQPPHAGHPGDLSVLGASAGAAIRHEPDRAGRRPLRLPRYGPGVVHGRPEGARRVRSAVRSPRRAR